MTRRLPIGLLVFALTLPGCGGCDAPKVVPKDKDSQGKKKPGEPDFSVDAKAMAKEFLDDEKAAKEKYADTLVEVTGEVKLVKAKNNFVLAGVKKDAEDIFGTWIGCYVLPQYESKAAYLSEGQKVKVVGKFIGFFTVEAKIGEAKLTELEPSHLFVATAKNLVNEFLTGARAASLKYAHKEVVVSGAVEDLVKDRFEYVNLTGSGTTHVKVTLNKGDWEHLQKGQHVVLRGSFSSIPFADNEVHIHAVMFLPNEK